MLPPIKNTLEVRGMQGILWIQVSWISLHFPTRSKNTHCIVWSTFLISWDLATTSWVTVILFTPWKFIPCACFVVMVKFNGCKSLTGEDYIISVKCCCFYKCLHKHLHALQGMWDMLHSNSLCSYIPFFPTDVINIVRSEMNGIMRLGDSLVSHWFAIWGCTINFLASI